MHTSRRDFLNLTLAAGTAAALGASACASHRPIPDTRRAPKKILILGGTAFLGPACVRAATARAHTVTVFNRGRIELKRKERGRPLDFPEGVEYLYGNRDPDKTADDWKDESKGEKKDPSSPKGLSSLADRTWDAVIDTSGYFPRMVKASATLLAPSVQQYLFISSVSAYAKMDTPGVDETAATATLTGPATEEFGEGFANYGGGKALCEKAAEAAMPGRVANIRPGFIVGPGDASARFIYWPLRVEKGGEMALPGAPTDPIQIIDVRDLADWLVRLIESGTMGVFNATGPASTLTMHAMVEGCKKATGADTTFTWVDPEFIRSHGIDPEAFSLWTPPDGEQGGIHRISIKRALATGLTFRSVDDTAKATLEWYRGLLEDSKKAAGRTTVTAEKEAALLKAWHAKS